jgi:hypothetical protein
MVKQEQGVKWWEEKEGKFRDVSACEIGLRDCGMGCGVMHDVDRLSN